MNGDERKRFLQEHGILPPDDDGLMPFPSDTSGQQDPGTVPADETKPEEKQAPFDLGASVANAGKAYANAYGIETPAAPVNPNDPKEKLKKLLTPEFMQKLRTRAGMTGE